MRVRLGDVLSSEFVRSESDFEPNYVLTRLKSRIHRVKVVGTVRSVPFFGQDGTYARFQLDDSTGVIWVSAFHSRVAIVENLAQGDMVQLVGTVNEYQGNLEIVAECVWKVHPNFWLLHRAEVVRSELENRKAYEMARSVAVHERNLIEAGEVAREIGLDAETVESLHREAGEEEAQEDIASEILDAISRLDAGGGVAAKDILDGLKGTHSREDVERELSRLMDEGEIYEPTVGRFSKI